MRACETVRPARNTSAKAPRTGRRRPSASRATSRWYRDERDRLRLALDGGKTIELVDCPYGAGAYQYLYERYDQAGRFYVIRTPAHEDFSYTLVMMRTGRLFTVYGAPVWASDKSRFLTVACSLLPQRGSLAIQAPADDELEDGRRDRAALRDRELFGALGSPIMDRSDVHTARGGQEGHGVCRDPWQRRQLEEVRALTHGWERATPVAHLRRSRGR